MAGTDNMFDFQTNTLPRCTTPLVFQLWNKSDRGKCQLLGTQSRVQTTCISNRKIVRSFTLYWYLMPMKVIQGGTDYPDLSFLSTLQLLAGRLRLWMIPSSSPVYRINSSDATAMRNEDGACRSVLWDGLSAGMSVQSWVYVTGGDWEEDRARSWWGVTCEWSDRGMGRESWLVSLLGIGYQVSYTRFRTSVHINGTESKHTGVRSSRSCSCGDWRRGRGRHSWLAPALAPHRCD